MTAAIRILKSPRPTNANLFAIEREEQVMIVAKRVAEAMGDSTPESVAACAKRLRSAKSHDEEDEIATIATSVSLTMRTHEGMEAMMAHGDMDIGRLLSLLEG
jgi:enoyl-CoA hydratase/carnithine racemase